MKRYPHRYNITYKHDITMLQYIKLFQKSKPSKHEISQFAQPLIKEATHDLERYFEMATRGKSRSNSSGFSTKFSTIALDSEQKEILKGWLKANSADLDEYFHHMVKDGWKTSVTWDDTNDCFIASATQRFDDDKNYDTCVTSRSDNLYEAILITYYKIFILFDGKKLPTEPTKQNWG